MDTLAHVVYGMTYCSLTGLAGGRTGAAGIARQRMLMDPTLWMAGGFGLLPDAASLGIPFVLSVAQGVGTFFRGVGEDTLLAYRLLHNALVPALVCLLVWRFRRGWFAASLAWPLHVLMDAVSHGPGKFQTRLFYPLSDWGFPGLNWWEHPWMFWTCWLALPPIWWLIWRNRRAGAAAAAVKIPSQPQPPRPETFPVG